MIKSLFQACVPHLGVELINGAYDWMCTFLMKALDNNVHTKLQAENFRWQWEIVHY